MPKEAHTTISEPAALAALTHPVRLKLLDHLMTTGPATASQCAPAVEDTPSNCSYHLRVLAKHGWVADEASEDARERPWRALITGFSIEGLAEDPDGPQGRQAAALLALGVQQEQQRVRDAVSRFSRLPEQWRRASSHNTFSLRMTAAELTELTGQLDALVRPYIAATREDPPEGSALVRLGLHAFPSEPAC